MGKLEDLSKEIRSFVRRFATHLQWCKYLKKGTDGVCDCGYFQAWNSLQNKL